MNPMEKINVGIVGVGNCASSLVQGVEYYRHVDPDERIPGLMHTVLGGYEVSDIQFTSAFDVTHDKVGKDISQAIYAYPNNTMNFQGEVPHMGVEVSRGRTLDGLGPHLTQKLEKANGPSVDVVQTLKDTDTHVLVNYLPVGSEEAAKFYAEAALQAGVAFINCMPVFIAADKTGHWPERFLSAGVPIIGDDIKSQVGATIVHRQLARLFEDRGVELLKTYQLNFGGNTDFLNMLDLERLKSKKISKTQSVQSQLEEELGEADIHIGPSDHVPWLEDRKWAQIRLEGEGFGGAPLNIELKLEVWDSPNSAGVVVDAIRYAKLALDRGMGGPLKAPSAYLMKSPPVQLRDTVAQELCEDFILGTDGGYI